MISVVKWWRKVGGMSGVLRAGIGARANSTACSLTDLVSQSPNFSYVVHVLHLIGKCNRGEKCPYIHDPDKIAVCPR